MLCKQPRICLLQLEQLTSAAKMFLLMVRFIVLLSNGFEETFLIRLAKQDVFMLVLVA